MPGPSPGAMVLPLFASINLTMVPVPPRVAPASTMTLPTMSLSVPLTRVVPDINMVSPAYVEVVPPANVAVPEGERTRPPAPVTAASKLISVPIRVVSCWSVTVPL